MQIRELTTEECRGDAAGHEPGPPRVRARYNRPYIVPVYFDFYEDALYSFATVGKKIQWMRTNPRVCVEIDEIVDWFNWTTVVVKGRYEELTKSPAHQAARKRAYLLFETSARLVVPGGGQDALGGNPHAGHLPHSDRRRERPAGRPRSGKGRPRQACSGVDEGAALVESCAAAPAGPAAGASSR